jgi:transcriptional regulator with XRE-family HTH domain
VKRLVGYEVSEAVARNVKLLRRSHGLATEALAERLGWTPAVISNIECGRTKAGSRTRRVTVDELAALANAFGIADPWSLTKRSECGACNGVPPAGFSCNTCGSGGT